MYFYLEPQEFFIHSAVLKERNFSTGCVEENRRDSFSTEMFYTIHRYCAKKSKTGIDVCGNVADTVLHGHIACLQSSFHFADRMKNGGVILGKFVADIRKAEVRQLADQIHGHLTGFRNTAVTLGTPQDGFVHGVEFADLTDDQTGCGKGIAFALEHIVNGPGNVGQVQRHIVQIPVGQNFLDRAFNLTDIVGHIDGNVIADIVAEVQTQLPCLVFLWRFL